MLTQRINGGREEISEHILDKSIRGFLMADQESADLRVKKIRQDIKRELPPAEGILKLKQQPSLRNKLSSVHDPIEQAMILNPGLTREEAEEMARNFGF